jgi:transcriptional regulator with XRE-family HTH domain
MSEAMAERLGRNVRQLRDARGMTQQQMARLSGLPRATWANLESGAANPTLGVLAAVAGALQVSIEELISPPRASARHPQWTEDLWVLDSPLGERASLDAHAACVN